LTATNRFAFMVSVVLAMSCSQKSHDQPALASTATRDTISLDSCAALDAQGAPQNRVLEPGETIPPPHPGSWASTKRVARDSFQLEVPSVANVGFKDTQGTYWVADLPGCRYFCALGITFQTDSIDRSLDQYVASLRVVDTAKDPDAEIPGLPHPIQLARSDGLMMSTPCGDCTSGEIVTKRGRTVAYIAYSIDDRDGYQPGLICRFARVASTFAWFR
jgi:hypothetical protein